MSDTAMARRLWAEANERAQQGRNLIDRSIELRTQALAALPVGVTLEFAFGSGRDDHNFRLVQQSDGSWASPQGVPVAASVVAEWWQAGNLRIKEGS